VKSPFEKEFQRAFHKLYSPFFKQWRLLSSHSARDYGKRDPNSRVFEKASTSQAEQNLFKPV
jgi:hypothetical protein